MVVHQRAVEARPTRLIRIAAWIAAVGLGAMIGVLCDTYAVPVTMVSLGGALMLAVCELADG